MTDRENVVLELEKITDDVNPWKESPPLRCDIPYPLLLNAITLLKAQEHIKPNVTKHKTGFGNVLSCWFNCGNCNKPIEHLTYKFCPYCGKGIKWDESEKND